MLCSYRDHKSAHLLFPFLFLRVHFFLFGMTKLFLLLYSPKKTNLKCLTVSAQTGCHVDIFHMDSYVEHQTFCLLKHWKRKIDLQYHSVRPWFDGDLRGFDRVFFFSTSVFGMSRWNGGQSVYRMNENEPHAETE